jgi:transcriptional regulator with XRE-family HTH domain
MMKLDDLARAAGLDPDSPDYRLRTALAEADDQLLEDLVRLRKDKGLTQQFVADRMHRDKAAVSNFERLSADPHLSTVRRYAAAIGACISHRVEDIDVIDSSDYQSVLVERLDAVLNDWNKFRYVCSAGSLSEEPAELDDPWAAGEYAPIKRGDVVQLDLYRKRTEVGSAQVCIACDG